MCLSVFNDLDGSNTYSQFRTQSREAFDQICVTKSKRVLHISLL